MNGYPSKLKQKTNHNEELLPKTSPCIRCCSSLSVAGTENCADGKRKRQKLDNDGHSLSSWEKGLSSDDSSESAEARSHARTDKLNISPRRALYHEQAHTFTSEVGRSCSSPTQSTQNQVNVCDQAVCYGALKAFDRVCLNADEGLPSPLSWDGGSYLSLKERSFQLSDRPASIISTLSREAGITFDFLIFRSEDSQTSTTVLKQKRRSDVSKSALTVNIYGPEDVADDIGQWLGSMGLYLETPCQCSLNVPYKNPHRLSDRCGRVTMTHQLDGQRRSQEAATNDDDDSMVSSLCTTRSYKEATHPVLLKSRLHPHQLQALTFMQTRELGWDVHNERDNNDLWQYMMDDFGRQKYVETISGLSSFRAPPSFKGGFLADEMGLGKTCSMLAVIAADIESNRKFMESHPENISPTSKSTLIIVPLPLLQVWENQIGEHFLPRAVSCITYYGTQKDSDIAFNDFDIVLTTYSTVSQEWRNTKSKCQLPQPVSSTCWHRIVLDEAHVIKNRHTDMAKAVTGLYADRKWCITGTPIQNRSSDLFSLIQFLKVYPYNDLKTFDKVFVQPWKNAETPVLLKLQQLMSTISIRRPRTTISLPPKEETLIPVELDLQERLTYEQAKKGFVETINTAIASEQKFGGAYLNALQRINDLRFICNHGVAPERKRDTMRSSFDAGDNSIEHELDVLFGAEDAVICKSCGQLIARSAEHDYLATPNVQLSYQKSKISCACSSPLVISSDSYASPIPPSPSVNSLSSPLPDSMIKYISCKVRAVVKEIKGTPCSEKCVVFSFRVTTLHLIAHALTLSSIPHIRYDGTMSRAKRDAVLARFSSEATNHIKVILISISCGGQGLDLTAANHAYLVEPQWNPMLEEQAMSRVYRLGQSRPVKLCRFVTRDTWEEQIVDLQRRKRKLAELIVDQRSLGGDGARRLLASLRDLV